MGWVAKIFRVGRVVEPAAPLPAAIAEPPAGVRGSLQIRHVDAGSCNGCEVEISGAFGPVYDAERFGARLVASPRHADALLVTGVVTHNMAGPLRKTLEATPRPRVVIACGDCALNRGVFADAYGVVGAVGEVVPVDVEIAGCGRTRGCLLRSTPETSRRLRSQIRESPDSPGRFTKRSDHGSSWAGATRHPAAWAPVCRRRSQTATTRPGSPTANALAR